jgi:hypothetical protein
VEDRLPRDRQALGYLVDRQVLLGPHLPRLFAMYAGCVTNTCSH